MRSGSDNQYDLKSNDKETKNSILNADGTPSHSQTYKVNNPFAQTVTKDSPWYDSTTSSFSPICPSKDNTNQINQYALYARSQAGSSVSLKRDYRFVLLDIEEFEKKIAENKVDCNIYLSIDTNQLHIMCVPIGQDRPYIKRTNFPDESMKEKFICWDQRSNVNTQEKQIELFHHFKKYLIEFIEKNINSFKFDSSKDLKALKSLDFYNESQRTKWSFKFEDNKLFVIKRLDKSEQRQTKDTTGIISFEVEHHKFIDYLYKQSRPESDNLAIMFEAKNYGYINQYFKEAKIKRNRMNPDKLKKAKENPLDTESIELLLSEAEVKDQSKAQCYVYDCILNERPDLYYIVKGNLRFREMIHNGMIHSDASPSKSGAMFSTIGGIANTTENQQAPRPKRELSSTIMKEEFDDKLLNYKFDKVKELSKKLKTTECIKVNPQQLAAQGPFLNIDIPDSLFSNKMMDGATRFYNHLIIAFINAELYKSGIGCYIDRRQSFGFMLTTATDVHQAIRLSIGLVPGEKWLEAVAKGILKFDTFLKNNQSVIENSKSDTRSIIHELYQMCMTTLGEGKSALDSYLHKVFLENIIQEQDVSLKCLHNSARNCALNKKADTTSESINVKLCNIDHQLIKLNNPMTYRDTNDAFKQYCEELFQIYSRLLSKYEAAVWVEKDEYIRFIGNPDALVNDVIRHLRDNLIGRCQVSSIVYYDKIREVGVTSDDDIDNLSHPFSSHTLRNTICGMEALYLPAIIHKETFCPEIAVGIYIHEYSYFELSQFMSETFTNKFYTNLMEPAYQTSDMADKLDIERKALEIAQIHYADVNPCIKKLGNIQECDTTFVDNIIHSILEPGLKENALFIFDTTSTTRADKTTIFESFQKLTKEKDISCVLCFSESALKNKGIGLEVPYGNVEVYYSDKYKDNATNCESKEAKFISKLEEMRGRSSAYSKHMRRDLRKAVSRVKNVNLNKDQETQKAINNEAESNTQPHKVSISVQGLFITRLKKEKPSKLVNEINETSNDPMVAPYMGR